MALVEGLVEWLGCVVAWFDLGWQTLGLIGVWLANSWGVRVRSEVLFPCLESFWVHSTGIREVKEALFGVFGFIVQACPIIVGQGGVLVKQVQPVDCNSSLEWSSEGSFSWGLEDFPEKPCGGEETEKRGGEAVMLIFRETGRTGSTRRGEQISKPGG